MLARAVTIALFSLLFTGSSAEAHFLFIRIGEPAEAGRSVEVFFSERAAAGDPRFIEKIARTTLAAQSASGKLEPLRIRRAADRLRASLPSQGPVSVTGFLEYGVLNREVKFLLRYYPKAIIGDPSQLAALPINPKAALEIDVRSQGDSLKLKLLRDGKPIPAAQFTTVDDDLVNEEFKADERGEASWKPPSNGYYCIYAKSVIKQAGEHQGAKYTEIREFATVGFPWPLLRSDADPAAVKLFQAAIANRATWKDFPGFTAEVSGVMDGRPFEGQLKVDREGDASAETEEEVAKPWVAEQLHSIATHRLSSPPAEMSPVLRFADRDEHHPLGRLLVFDGGQFASSYRVSGGRINVVNRCFGGENMTITVLEESNNQEGRSLPHAYSVQYWDAKSGDLLRTETVSNRWTRVGDFDLPASITTTTASSGGLSVRSIALRKHALLPKTAK